MEKKENLLGRFQMELTSADCFHSQFKKTKVNKHSVYQNYKFIFTTFSKTKIFIRNIQEYKFK